MTAIPLSSSTVLQGVRRVLFVHAHPDDETISTGALIAALVDRGTAVDLVTATRGEMGEVVPGPLSSLAGTPDLEEHRAGELAGALDELGIARHAWLGTPPARVEGLPARVYRDSGMEWIRPGLAGPADATDERAFTHGDPEQATADLVALVESWQPDLLISYDAGGGYGHPDHVRCHEITRVAAERTGTRLAEVWMEPGPDVEWFTLDEQAPTLVAALRHHATQLTVQPGEQEIVHSGGQRDPLVTSVGLRAVAI